MVALLAVAGCGQTVHTATPSAGSPAADVPVARVARDAAFVLALHTPSAIWSAGQPIELQTLLTYVGPLGSLEVRGSGSGLVSFAVEQLNGPLDVGGASTLDCAPYQMSRDAPMAIKYVKSGGWSEDDPNAAVFRAFVVDPLLRLPAGSFVITATFTGYLGGCGGEEHTLSVELPLTVMP